MLSLRLPGEVCLLDVYHTLRGEEIRELESGGVALEPSGGFDLVVAPVHLDPDHPVLVEARRKGVQILTHHQMVGRLLRQEGLDGKMIEVTGTRGKTSTSVILADILSRCYRVASHTSLGLYYLGERVASGRSITPASILWALDVLKEKRLEADFYIFEDSLGGTGVADLGIITTLRDDYPIAGGKRLASEAKKQMADSHVLVANRDAAHILKNRNGVFFFSETPAPGCQVWLEGGRLEPLGVRVPPGLESYDISLTAAVAAALALEVPASVIEKALWGFQGIPGRMKIGSFKGRLLLDNSNSGLTVPLVEKALDRISKEAGGRDVCLILGEDRRQVCEGLDPGGVRRFLEGNCQRLKGLVLVGERIQPLKGVCSCPVRLSSSLEEALDLALELTLPGDAILSCVKCFR